MEVFLSHKSMQDWPDNEGRSAFMWAAGKGADDVIKVFIKHKVDMHQSDKNGGTGTPLRPDVRDCAMCCSIQAISIILNQIRNRDYQINFVLRAVGL